IRAAALGRRADDADHLSERVLNDRLLARVPGEHVVELELEAGEALVVDSCVTEDLRRERALRVGSPFLRVEAQAGQVFAPEARSGVRVGLSLDVDKAARAVLQLAVELVAIDPEVPRRGDGYRARVLHPLRIGVDRRRLLAERERDARAVEDGATRSRERHDLAVLSLRHRAQGLAAHRLHPE